MKKLFSFLLILVLFGINISTSLAETDYFSDVDSTHPNYGAIQNLRGMEIIKGYPDGTFQPEKEINRAELLTILANYKGGKLDAKYKSCFTDVKEEWYAAAVCYGKGQGWVEGYADGTFQPAKNTNRAEAIKIIVNAMYGGAANIPELTMGEKTFLNLPTNVEPSAWYYDLLVYTAGKNILDPIAMEYAADGSYSYQIGGNIRRREVAEMIDRIMKVNGALITNYEDELIGKWRYEDKKMIDGDEVIQSFEIELLVNNQSAMGDFFYNSIIIAKGTSNFQGQAFAGEYYVEDYGVEVSWPTTDGGVGEAYFTYDPIGQLIIWESTSQDTDSKYMIPQFMRLEKVAEEE